MRAPIDRSNVRTLVAVLVSAMLGGACSDEGGVAPTETVGQGSIPAAADRLGEPDHLVSPGGSIQAAVDAAEPGDVIHVEPGTYAEAIVVDKPGIRLVGLEGSGRSDRRAESGRRSEPVVIENPGDANNGIFVTDNGDGFELINVTVRNFGRNGVLLVRVDGFLLSGVITEGNGIYGLFPVVSSDGVIEFSSATGHADAGIYVGVSEGIVVRRNVAFGNVIGFEIENSSNVRVVGNDTYDNTAGMLIVLLPGLSVTVSEDVVVSGNRVHDNDRPNFAEPGALAAAVPTGSGVLVVGTDRTIVTDNEVTGNDFVGIGLGSTLLLGALAGLPPEAFEGIEPNPDGARILNNVVTGNGAAPPALPIPLPGVDLLWDGSGTDNCWGGNAFAASFPSPLPTCDPTARR
jgi:parallel beta-helix repeat protein